VPRIVRKNEKLMGQSVTRHLLERGRVVTSQSLRAELRYYADAKHKTALSKRNVKRFLSEMHDLLRLTSDFAELVAAIDHDKSRTDYSIDECLAFFVQTAEPDMLSESLREHVAPAASVEAARTKTALQLQTATTMEPFDSNAWCPPAQSFLREWSLILMCRGLR
jgi:hypothetical protein